MVLNDWIPYGKVVWSAATGVWRFYRRNRRKLTPQQKLELRAKWKVQVESWILTHNRQKLRHDCIIRDMKRMDRYPDVTEGKGISAWFRAALIDTYENGIMVGLRWEGLV